MQMTYLGAAGTVTCRYVLIGCVLFQGYKQQRLHNRAPFQLPVRDPGRHRTDPVHVNHSGCLPVLVRSGYRGPVDATPATRELIKILLLDSDRFKNMMPSSPNSMVS